MKLPPNDPRPFFEPSKFSGSGFLGDDPRPVEEIIADDARELEQSGIAAGDLALALEAAYRKSRDALGVIVEVAPGVRAEFFESRGRIPCPFKGCGAFEKGESSLSSPGSQKPVIITSLGIHMIKSHGFFQGRGSRYRIEPVATARMLNINHSD